MDSRRTFVAQLAETTEEMSLQDFLVAFHKRFYPTQDISMMEYFSSLCLHPKEFIVPQHKLNELGVSQNEATKHVVARLVALGLVEGSDFRREKIASPDSNKTRTQCMLTPHAFKMALIRARFNRPLKQKYLRYFLLIEKTFKFYTEMQSRREEIRLRALDATTDYFTTEIDNQEQQLGTF